MAPLYSMTSLATFAVLMSVLISHGTGMRITQQDYETRSHSALLQGIQAFQIDKTELFPELQSAEDISLDEIASLKKCACHGFTCGCCLHVKIKKVELDADVCLNVSYLPKEIGAQVQLIVDGRPVFTKKVSAKNPPAICAGVPGLKKLASLCVRLYDLSISGHQFSGCVELQARLAKVLVEKVKLGCFKVPPKIEFSSSYDNSLTEDNNVYEIVQVAVPMNLKPSYMPSSDEIGNLKNCACHDDSCGCCLHVGIKAIHLDADVCLKVSYLPKEIGAEVQLTVDGKAIFTKKVSVENPPAICAAVPGLKKMASLCIRLYDLSVAGHHLSGCVDLEARLAYVFVEKVHVGCFKVPPKIEDSSSYDNSLTEDNNVYEIEQVALPMNLKPSYKPSSVAELFQESNSKACSCQKDSCQCCAHLKVARAHLDADVCFKASFLPQELGFQAEITVDGKTIFKQKVSVENPPPICGTFEDTVTLCLVLKDLHISGKALQGCAEVEVKLTIITVGKFNLGCFKIPPKEHDMRIDLLKQLAPTLLHSILGEEDAKEVMTYFSSAENSLEGKKCQSGEDSYSCCIEFPSFGKKRSVCLKIAFLPNTLGADLQVLFDGKVIFHQKVTVNDPPPICVPLPFEKSASVCLKFTNLQLHKDYVSGCLAVAAKLKNKTLHTFKLGCFKLPPKEEVEDSLEHVSCKAGKDSYSCCIDLKVFGKDRSVCLKVVFIPNVLGVDLQIIFDGKMIFHHEVKVNDPPPICVQIPVEKSVSICLKLDKLALHKDGVSGCLDVDVKLDKITVKKFDLGCFKIPPKVKSQDLIGAVMEEVYYIN